MWKLLTKLTCNIVYRNDMELLNNPYKRSQNYFILQAVFGTIFSLLTGGVFLSGFAVYLGASDELISYITILPTICGIFLVIGGIFLERVHSKKKAVILFIILSKTLICLLVSIPLLVPKAMQQTVLLFVLIAAYTIQALNGVIINKWFISVVPGNIRGRYFAVRQFFALSISVILPLMTGRFMDTMKDKYTGFIVLYSLGLLAMAVEIFAFSNIDEPSIESMERNKIKFIDVIRLPLKNKEFCSYVITLFVFYVLLFLSSSFTSAYMIRYLKLSYTVMNIISVLPAVLQLFMLRIWGALGDKYGHQFVMKTSMWFFAGETLMWAIASKTTLIIFIPLACFFSAAGNSGFGIGVFNRRYMIIPEKGRAIYDGFYSAAIGIALLTAPILGGISKSFLASSEFVQRNINFGEFRILYLFSSLGIIALQVFIVITGRNKKNQGGSYGKG